MTLTPDAPQPDDNDKLRKEEAPTESFHAPQGYGDDNVAPEAHPNTPPAPSYSPTPPSPYAVPGQAPGYENYGPNHPAGQTQGMYHNPQGYVPQEDMWTKAKQPENMSAILGGGSIFLLIFSFITGPLVIASPVLAIFGLLQANKANRFGVPATLGKVLSWIGIGLNALGLLLIIMFFGVFMAAIASGMH